MAETILQVVTAHDRFVDSLVGTLDRRIRKIFNLASARTGAELQRRLEIQNGVIQPTAANQRTLRQVEAIFLESLDTAGYNRAVQAFVDQFPRQLQFFDRTLRAINRTLKDPLPEVDLTVNDFGFLRSHRISSVTTLIGLTLRLASQSRERALLAVGGLPLDNLIDLLADQFSKGQTQVASLAATATSTHYRVIQDRGYRIIERERGGPLKFIYVGPRDKLNRRFCSRILGDNKPRTRKQINRLDNLSALKPVFTAAGGFNCRHQWVLVSSSTNA